MKAHDGLNVSIHGKAEVIRVYEEQSLSTKETPTFREDLQAIRAIAIISVVLYHFFPTLFPHGHGGVDQFFVLSGFLMSMMSEREEHFGKNEIAKFYYRRLKRIVPSYLLMILLTILAFRRFYIENLLYANMSSAKDALFFITNIEAANGLKQYEKKLAEGADAFTHTWSIALEMQFYAIFPLLIMIYRRLPQQFAMKGLIGLGAISLFLHMYERRDRAFNLVHARLWQFVLGIFVQQLDKKSVNSGPEGISAYVNKKYYKICLLGVFYFNILMYREVGSLYIRILSAFLTAGLILFYPTNEPKFMSSKYLSYIGYISYSLYLVHWPIYIFLKQNFIEDYGGLACGIALAVVIAVIFTELFEKPCLKSGVKTVLFVSACLYIMSLLLIRSREGFNFFEQEINWSKSLFTPNCWANNSDAHELCNIPFNGSKLSRAQRKRLNSLFTAADVPLLLYERCIYREAVNKPWGLCDLPPVSNIVKRKVLVIGNSYAANQGRIVYEMCHDSNTEVKIYSIGGCEVLVTTAEYSHCVEAQEKFYEVVHSYKPDVLFILSRYLDLIDSPESRHLALDDTAQEASRVLRGFSRFTTNHIFVLNVLPRPRLHFAKEYENAFNKGRILDSKEMLNETVSTSVGQRRLTHAVSACSKCSIIDYEPVFRVNGTFQLYDADSNIAFMNGLFHFTPLGLHKLRPFFKDICDQISYSESSRTLHVA